MSKYRDEIALFIGLTAFLILAILTGCSASPPEYVYTQPENSGDGIPTGTLDTAGLDFETLARGIDSIRDGDFKAIHSLLIYKDGALVLEEYFAGQKFTWDNPSYLGAWSNWGPNEPHVSMSVSKSFVSALTAIAIEEGFIGSIDDPIFDYLPEYQQYATGGKQSITIEHLVTMTSGLAWDEWGASFSDSNNNDAIRIYYCDDQVECILEVPLDHEPGTTFTYSGGNMVLLGQIIYNTTGMYLDEFAAEYLYAPLGIQRQIAWNRYPSGIVDAVGGASHTSREMLKLGITYLNGGVWDGQQVIPAEWVEHSSVPYGSNTGIKVPGEDGGKVGYGYTWWTSETRQNGENLDMFYADGWGGQRIIVIPDLDMVVVMTAGNYTMKTTSFRLMERVILPAVGE